ncbi:MAG TPA: riboflavin synthase [Steroidobacteraceae bacterium]|jgi:riboflavin synthase|nr:riboflavin synthase [Steroidobacteraceae bacterium]
MFTGIVQDLGRIVSRETRGVDARITIATERLKLANVAIGDSICVQGVCLTVTSLAGNAFTADVSHETLSLTTLGELQVNAQVNLEPSLRAGDPLGGHLVSGHVDGVARVTAVAKDGDSLRVTFDAPRELARYIARKGSVAVDGVSLTVNEVAGTTFGVNLIPHTQSVTTLGRLQVGARVNLEVDPIARYVERLSQMS